MSCNSVSCITLLLPAAETLDDSDYLLTVTQIEAVDWRGGGRVVICAIIYICTLLGSGVDRGLQDSICRQQNTQVLFKGGINFVFDIYICDISLILGE